MMGEVLHVVKFACVVYWDGSHPANTQWKGSFARHLNAQVWFEGENSDLEQTLKKKMWLSNTDRLKMNEKFEIWEASLVSGMNAFFYSFFELFRVQHNTILFI